MSKSNTKTSAGKTEKPYPDFPLFMHATGRWAKKIRGRLEYFGSRADGSQNALDNYLAWRDDLYAGRRPRKDGTGKLSVADLCNRFLESREQRRDAGVITNRTWLDYKRSTDIIVKVLGKTAVVEHLRPADFTQIRRYLAERLKSPESLGNEVNRMRVVFGFASKEGLIDRPLRFGEDFARPRKDVIDRTRAMKRLTEGRMMFEAEEIHALLRQATGQFPAMIYLAINCALDNASVGQLVAGALDLDGRQLDFPRFKGGAERKCPLWTETCDAIREALKTRPTAKGGHEQVVFLTRCGTPWHKDDNRSPLSQEFRKIMKAAGVYRKGRGFRALRHTFETVAGGSRDQVAVNHIMAHSEPGVSHRYREMIEDDRLQAVVAHVHNWLWPPRADEEGEEIRPVRGGRR
ncbi:MAG: tyrosine-type recombinase/integrase [Pirellulaceae bacterium]